MSLKRLQYKNIVKFDHIKVKNVFLENYSEYKDVKNILKNNVIYNVLVNITYRGILHGSKTKDQKKNYEMRKC